MTDPFDFLSPVPSELLEGSWGGIIPIEQVYHGEIPPLLDGVKVAIFSVEEDRLSVQNAGCAAGGSAFRRAFYALNPGDKEVQLVDMGILKAGATYEDTEFALSTLTEHLLRKQILPVVIGGSQDLTYSMYKGFERMEQVINLVNIDSCIDLGQDEELHAESYLRNIVLHKPNFLFNFANIAHQRPLVHSTDLELIDKMFFDELSLGKIFENIHQAEPIIRNADLLSFDMSSIRFSDAPGCANAGPNGLYADQACQLMKYAGMSDKLNAIGLFEYNPEKDNRGITGALLAELVWYFLDGFANRKEDYPIGSKEDYLKYIVPLEREDYEIVFYKSPKSDRWWMDVPYGAGTKNRYQRHHLVPCSYAEYQTATNDDMPDLWWRTFQKLV